MRVYAYGARPPIEGAEFVQQQLRMAIVYQRELTLLEIRRRNAVERLYRRACPSEWTAYEQATAAVIAAAQAMRLTRARPGDMLDADEDMQAEKREETQAARDALAAARQREAEARQSWKDARKKQTPRLRPGIKRIDRAVKAKVKHAYNVAGAFGLAWGTRLKVGEFVERAAEMSAKAGSMPKLPRFDGAGAIVVQLQGASGIDTKNGLAPKDAHAGSDTRFRLEYVDHGTWQMMQRRRDGSLRSAFVSKTGRPLPQSDPDSRRSRRRAENGGHYAIARIRIGSDGRAPVWAAWPVVVHRPLPPDAPIKWAQMHARHIGARTEWMLQLTIDEADPDARAKGPTLAVNLGWRNKPFDAGLRVAYAVGTDGHEEEVLVPPAYIAGVRHVASLRSIRDRIFEDAKKSLVEWAETTDVPDWFVAECRFVDRWRSQRKLVRFLSIWRARRFDGDAEMWQQFADWQKQDRHLWFWESDEGAKLIRMRREFYRVTAARWATRYARVLVTDMDLREFATAPEPEEGARSDGKEQRISQRLAAPSELRACVRNACSTRGSVFVEIDGAFKTQTCNSCGIVFAFAAKTDLQHTCQCGARSDQDANHCRNLLASDKVTNQKRKALAPSVTTENEPADRRTGRWQKRRSQTASQVSEAPKKSA